MADQPSHPPAGAPGQKISRKQLILIGALGIGLLIIILYGQPASDDSVGDTGAETGGTVEALPSRRPSASAPSPVRKDRWPVLAIARVIQTNPFAELAPSAGASLLQNKPVVDVVAEPVVDAVPEDQAAVNDASDRDARAHLSDAIADLKSRKVSTILRINGKKSALIGDRIVHEGDVIDGFRIVTIGPTGVIVQAAPRD